MKQSASLRGTKDGYYLQLDDRASFDVIFQEIQLLFERLKNEKKKSEDSNESEVFITVQSASRYLSEHEREKIATEVERESNFKIKRFEADVVELEHAFEWHERNQTIIETKNIRSGQNIEVSGNILLVGDVHQGGVLKAAGSVIVLGQLKGLVQAGFGGDDKAVVIANFQYNAQIRIGDNVHIIEPKEKTETQNVNNNLQVAYMNDLHILEFTSLNELKKLRPELGKIVGRLE